MSRWSDVWLTCLQQVERVGHMEFTQQRDKRTNGQMDKLQQNTNCECYGKTDNMLRGCYDEVSDLSGVLLPCFKEVGNTLTDLLRASYEETALIEFSLYQSIGPADCQ